MTDKQHPNPRDASPTRSRLEALARAEDAAARLYTDLSNRWDDRHSLRAVDVLLGNHKNNRDLLDQLAGHDEVMDARPQGDEAEASAAEAIEQVSQCVDDLLQRELAASDLYDLEELESRLLAAYEAESAPEIQTLSSHALRLLRAQMLRRAQQNTRVIRLMPHRRGDAVRAAGSERWVDQVADQSFPASDPPPWTGAHA